MFSLNEIPHLSCVRWAVALRSGCESTCLKQVDDGSVGSSLETVSCVS